MDALTRATPSAMKSFITRRNDRFRPPYGKHIVNLPRQCVFAGTINPPENGGRYLKDPTGARRIWPVACRGMLDRAGVERDRDQLWAEAVHRFKAGASWWLETPELEALATAEQEARFVIDLWEDDVRIWVGDRSDVSVAEFSSTLGVAPERHSQAAQTRIAKILKGSLGFTKYRPQTAKGRENRYWRGALPVKVDRLKYDRCDGAVIRHTGHTEPTNKIKERRHDTTEESRAGARRSRG